MADANPRFSTRQPQMGQWQALTGVVCQMHNCGQDNLPHDFAAVLWRIASHNSEPGGVWPSGPCQSFPLPSRQSQPRDRCISHAPPSELGQFLPDRWKTEDPAEPTLLATLPAASRHASPQAVPHDHGVPCIRRKASPRSPSIAPNILRSLFLQNPAHTVLNQRMIGSLLAPRVLPSLGTVAHQMHGPVQISRSP